MALCMACIFISFDIASTSMQLARGVLNFILSMGSKSDRNECMVSFARFKPLLKTISGIFSSDEYFLALHHRGVSGP